MNDGQIISQCNKGDRSAQNLLFQKFERKVFGICLRYASSTDEAKDLQQETFIKVFQSLTRDTRIQSLDAWVSRIAVNTAIDHFRKQRRFARLPAENEPAIPVSPEILDKLNEEELMTLIQTIPDPYRIVFNLYIVEGFNHKEVASMLAITESTSRAYLVRAREHLIKSLNVGDKSKKNRLLWTA